MPRKIVPIIPFAPYHITSRCVNREWFNLPLETVWSIMEDYLFLVNAEYQLRIHAFVLMANHFHLFVTPTLENFSFALLYFMRETSKEITRLSGRINQTYGGRNHKTLIQCDLHFMNTYKYLYQNPIRAGICGRAEEYRYSTLSGLCGLRRMIVPLVEDKILFTPEFNFEALEWINTRPDAVQEEHMRLALRRPHFEAPICARTKRVSSIDMKLI